MMLQPNLLYTAITRAKKLVGLVGSRRALAAAVRTVGAGRRHTALTHRLAPQRGNGSRKCWHLPAWVRWRLCHARPRRTALPRCVVDGFNLR